MVLEKILGKLNIRGNFTKLIIGSILAALAISLGMVGILRLFGFSINPAIPASFAAVGAAVYAARMRRCE